MAIADIRQRPGVLLGAAILLHVVLISAQVNTASGLPILQVVTFGSFSEAAARARWRSIGGVRGMWSGYVALQQVQEENTALKHELQTLQVRLQQERAEAQRTDNLRQLLELRERAQLDTVAAEVIAGAASPDFRTVTIDKGSSDGLATDMAVISPAGVVGRVILPSRRASKVQLLIDRNAAAGALIERTRVQGVVIGVGDGMLRMQYVPGTADVKTGDLVVTSGIDGIYPKGFVIGTIDHADRGVGAYHEIIVRPAVDFSRLEEVLIVRTPPASRARDRGAEVRSAVALAAILIAIARADDAVASWCFGSGTAIDLVLIVVVYVAIKSGPSTGLLAGTVAGLIQDALSSGILGIGGLAKTMVGFLSGVLGHAVHRDRAAAEVPAAADGHGPARGDFHGAVHAAEPAAVSGAVPVDRGAGLRKCLRRRGGVSDD